MADQGIVAIYELRRRGNSFDLLERSRALTLSMGNNTRRGVLDHILGLRKDQLARGVSGKTLPGWALWCSGARTVFALGADPLAP